MELGRRFSPDIRDKHFLMRRRLGKTGVSLPTSKTWRIGGKSLDQKDTSTCVGHAWRNFLRCAPRQTEKGGPSPFDIYRWAVGHDEWSGNDNEAVLPDGDPKLDDGTSIRAGADAVVSSGVLEKSYLWAFSLSSTIEWVLTKGPVVMGTNWYTDMSKPNSKGIIKIGGIVEGGHAYLLRGVNTKTRLALCENSWGDGWGLNGMFFLPFTDLERLLHEQGEACTAIEQKLVPDNPALKKPK